MKRGQVSVEFITIFGFVFLMTIPLIIIFFDQTGYIEDGVAQNQLRSIAIKITDKAETVYYSGEPTKTTIKAEFPPRIVSITILPRQIQFIYRSRKNIENPITFTSLVNMTGSLSIDPGRHTIQIQATGDGVSITEP